MVMKIQVKVFCIVMLRGIVVGYQNFRGPCCLYCQCNNLQYYVASEHKKSQSKPSVCVHSLLYIFQLLVLLTYSLTHSNVQHIIWKANLSLSLSNNILLSLWNPKFHYYVFSAVISRQVSLLASKRVSVFYFMVFILSPNKLISPVDMSHSIPNRLHFLGLSY